MQIPKRKSEENRKYGKRADNFLSSAALAELRSEQERLEKVSRPRAVTDLTRAREMGDLSENAAYSEAKGRLFGIDRRLAEIRDRLKNAVVIQKGAAKDGSARLGATVRVRVTIEGGAGKEREYELTGAAETDPASGKVSHHSPLGAALLGKRAGDKVQVKAANGKEVLYEILEVS